MIISKQKTLLSSALQRLRMRLLILLVRFKALSPKRQYYSIHSLNGRLPCFKKPRKYCSLRLGLISGHVRGISYCHKASKRNHKYFIPWHTLNRIGFVDRGTNLLMLQIAASNYSVTYVLTATSINVRKANAYFNALSCVRKSKWVVHISGELSEIKRNKCVCSLIYKRLWVSELVVAKVFCEWFC